MVCPVRLVGDVSERVFGLRISDFTQNSILLIIVNIKDPGLRISGFTQNFLSEILPLFKKHYNLRKVAIRETEAVKPSRHVEMIEL